MAVSVNNSLSDFLEQSLILEKNSLETISKINDAVVSTEDTVTLTLTDPNDSSQTKTYQIPSFGYLKNAITRLDANISNMSNITSSGSSIRLSDGTYRKIIATKLPSEAPTITTVNNVTNFEFKSNWFFEDLLNPRLYISWDLSDQISSDTTNVIVQRYLLKCNNPLKITIFNRSFKGKNNINYSDFVKTLVKYQIQYTVDEDVRQLPPRQKRYSGEFTVLRTTLPKADYNGKVTKNYKLSTIEYTDNNTTLTNSRKLAVGDYLEVVTNPVTTRYKVTYVDTNTNQVQLSLIEGGEPVTIGTKLKIYSAQDTDVNIEIPVGYGEREVIFMKPVDPDSQIPANDWSPGVGFYTNELTYTDSKNQKTTLAKFYQSTVVDFGQVMLSYAIDYYPTVKEGRTPTKPTLIQSNFKVIRINDHLTENYDTIQSLVSSKQTANSNLSTINDKVAAQKIYLQTTSFVTEADKSEAYNTLASLISQQYSASQEYYSYVNQLSSLTSENGYIEPKYRVRGFWSIPNPVTSAQTGEQKIIKFKVRYRYLSENGTQNDIEEYPIVNSQNTVVATAKFSNWIEFETKCRSRILSNGEYKWADVDVTDENDVKINQLDIPIRSGESVEIQVKSVSEAGWPSNPLTSSWSNSVVVNFSDYSNLTQADTSSYIQQNMVDAALATYANTTQNVSEHMNTSFYTNDKYFAHTAETITSGFLTDEQTPITLYDKLKDLNTQISTLNDKLNRASVGMIVTVTDEDNKVYTLTEGSTTYIYAGDYTTAKKSIDSSEQTGAIITKTFQIGIRPDGDSVLDILSKVVGNRTSMCPSSRAYNYTQGEEPEDTTTTTSSSSSSTYVATNTTAEEREKILNSFNFSSSGNSSYMDFINREKHLMDGVTTITATTSDIVKGVSNTYGLITADTSTGISVHKPDYEVDYELYNYLNSYELYDNVINPKSIASAYYATRGRYDLVPINLTNSDIIDYQVASPNMYQSAQCCGQFVYCRFTNIDGTMNLYANALDNNQYGLYDDLSFFAESEITYGGEKNALIWSMLYKQRVGGRYTISKTRIAKDFMSLIGEEINNVTEDADFYENVSLVMNRLPITYNTQSSTSSVSNNTTLLTRLANSEDISNNTRYNTLLTNRLKNDSGTKNATYTIKPKIQNAYGFGNIVDNIPRKDGCSPCYLTTHKIGYESKDRYAEGEDSCNSFLFLSPSSHSSIQVSGDTSTSSKTIESSDVIYIPMVFQYRMEDINGYIFGDSSYNTYTDVVQKTKYANIIGLDIWSDVLADLPKQYDIIVYATYGGTTLNTVNTIQTNTVTQSVLNAANLANLGNVTLLNKSVLTSH
jgi:hypothetical protein